MYDVGATNTNRLVRFLIEGKSGSSQANLFNFVSGPAGFYPRSGRIVTPTNNQLLAQLRVSLIVRRLTVYCPVAEVKIVPDSAAHANGGLQIGFEQDQMGVFFNNAWFGNVSLAKHVTTDIADSVGTGGMSATKTKPGLATMLAALGTVSYDGGTTGPFGTLSASGAVVLPSQLGGGTTSGAPALDSGVASGYESGLQISLIN